MSFWPLSLKPSTTRGEGPEFQTVAPKLMYDFFAFRSSRIWYAGSERRSGLGRDAVSAARSDVVGGAACGVAALPSDRTRAASIRACCGDIVPSAAVIPAMAVAPW